MDAPGDVDQVRRLVQELGLTFDVLHDPDGAIRRTDQVRGVPESFLIGRDGVVRKKVFVHDRDTEGSRALVRTLLAASARWWLVPRRAA